MFIMVQGRHGFLEETYWYILQAFKQDFYRFFWRPTNSVKAMKAKWLTLQQKQITISCNTTQLQRVLNAAVRLVSNTRKYVGGLTYVIRRNVLH